MMNSYSVFYIEQKTELEKCNCFLVDFLRYSFGRIKVISAVVEREYTPNITRKIWFAYQLTGFFKIKGFIEWLFPNRLSPYFRKPLLFRKCARLLF